MLKKRNQKGFTLIEIIAVLVILGILAAVAIPKYFSMQDEARASAIQGAIAAASSNLNMSYAKYLVAGSQNASLDNLKEASKSWTLADNVGDFGVTYVETGGTTTACKINIAITQKTDAASTGGATWVTSYAGAKTKDVICPWVTP